MNLPLLDSPLIELLAQQSGSVSWAQKAAAMAGSIFALTVVLGSVLAAHLFHSFCLKRICEKAGHNPGLLVWFPILNIIPRMQAAKLPLWLLALYLLIFPIPFIFVYNWMMLCVARGKPAPLGLLAVFPLTFFGLFIYLAFAD